MRRLVRNVLLSPWTWTLVAGFGLFAFAFAILTTPAVAAPVTHKNKPPSDFCLACHQQEGQHLTLGTDQLSVTIDPTVFGFSIHAQRGLVCVDCHSNISDYPHPAVSEQSARDFALSYSNSCRQCHKDQYDKVRDSVHQAALDAGNVKAPLCTDCHDPHTQTRVTGQESGQISIAARLKIPLTCARCHQDKYDQYKASVHGKALTEEGNRDVPTCTDCHGVHHITNPQTASFRNSVPELCAKCHTNPSIMGKYGISTNVVSTYVADFHGTTVKLFTQQFPDQPTNKPVCTDCHGVHDISDVNNPKTGIAIRENLLPKCQRCHPGASANFPGAWMNHYAASPQHYPLVFYVSLFYKLFIPAVIGGMILFVISDIYRRRVDRAKGATHS